MTDISPEKQRQFAIDTIRKLRDAGYIAYWAGGCVRDQLLGRTPKDYDVATGATPPRIRELFGRRRTLAIGAAFGVITVMGPPGAGQIEVATFRRETTYSDGRHPDSVSFSSAREDASRRDFTINGMFYDPLEQRVIDFVGGQEDLQRRLIRSIGDPDERIGEDKLRMLRAVRFAATFVFNLEAATREAIRRRAGEIHVVSAERIAEEMRKMLVDTHRARAVRLLFDTALAAEVLPEIVPGTPPERRALEQSMALLEQLEQPGFPLALAALLARRVAPDRAEEICRRWRLSNKETERVRWLLEHRDALRAAPSRRWSEVQPLLIAAGARDLLALAEAEARIGWGDRDDVAWCRRQLERLPEDLDPQPLVTGDDLKRHGVPPGPAYSRLLDRVRKAQLDREISTREGAFHLVDRLLSEQGNHDG